MLHILASHGVHDGSVIAGRINIGKATYRTTNATFIKEIRPF